MKKTVLINHFMRILIKLFSFDRFECCRYITLCFLKNVYFQAFRKAEYVRQFSFSLHAKRKIHNEKILNIYI